MAALSFESGIKLKSGYVIPQIGYGVRVIQSPPTMSDGANQQHSSGRREDRSFVLLCLDVAQLTLLSPPAQAKEVVTEALKVGYRHVSRRPAAIRFRMSA